MSLNPSASPRTLFASPQDIAKVGVVGPTRMDYPGTMAAVRAIARYLSRILTT